MTKGLDVFRDAFAQYTDCFVVIGGTACDLLFTEVGLSFRATKDIDIVLCVEAVQDDFARTFWDFIKAGEYARREGAAEHLRYYRFSHPANEGYPVMLELFSRSDGMLSGADSAPVRRISLSGDVSSLSAIVLNTEYYEFLKTGVRIIEGIPVVDALHLIPLKARAWYDLHEKHNAGEAVDAHDVKKHRNDIVRLLQLLPNEFQIQLPETVEQDIVRCCALLPDWHDYNNRQFGVAVSLEQIIAQIKTLYGLGR